MAKTLCDWKKAEIVDKIDKLYALVQHPRFVCRKCARVANTDQVLCKPTSLPVSSWGQVQNQSATSDKS